MVQAKKKGSQFERDVAKKYIEYEIDKNATRMPLSGADEYLKGDIRHAHPMPLPKFVDECKAGKNIEWQKWWKQTKEQCHVGEEPLLHFKKDYQEPLSLVKTDTLFELMGQLVSLYNENEDLKNGTNTSSGIDERQIQYSAKNIKEMANKILKEF